MSRKTDRRTFVKDSLVAPAAMALSLQAGGSGAFAQEAPKDQPAAENTLPKGRIGDIDVSRLLLGGNLLTHFTHSRDLKYVYNLAAHYNTDEKILETLALSEQNGIDTLVVHTVPAVINTLRKHREERGGKIKWIICPTAPVEDGMEKYSAHVQKLVDIGVDAIYLWGVWGDQLAEKGRMDLLSEAVEVGKKHGIPSGVGAHDLKVIKDCEAQGVNADFYIKTFHHHKYPSGPKPEDLVKPYQEFPGYWCLDPEDTIQFMETVEKPWIAFKVMAAGAIPPDEAFQYVFEKGADHILAGMFDFEIAEDAGIIKDALKNVKDRTRPWRS